MVDNIKFNKISSPLRTSKTTNKVTTTPQENATVIDAGFPIESVLTSLINDPPPAESPERLSALKLNVTNNQYPINYEVLAEDMLVEYLDK